MSGEERREQLVARLQDSSTAISGTTLAKELGVSRQVIVQDVALLRANQIDILSTRQGYILKESNECKRVFKVIHTDEQVGDELSLFVDCGGRVEDVFVYHKIYGLLRAPMDIRSRLDVKRFMEDLAAGKSSLLKNITSGYHYHTVYAQSEKLLDYIENELWSHGFLAKVQDYEPEEFKRQLEKAQKNNKN